ncbi:hypothetical protein AEM42_14835 [Betaproteobacteria bacterium UKL13-2]|nr:hypothetical protein AEM42_14835 [Betaproteobacteria bacterium UKL13-2]
MDGKSDGKSDGTVVAIAVDKNAPFSRIYLANKARDAVVGQAKNRSPVHLLTRFRTRPHEMFRLEVGGFTSLCLVLVGLGWSWLVLVGLVLNG